MWRVRSRHRGRHPCCQEIWNTHQDEEEYGFTMVDYRKTFNEINCIAMLWPTRHLWPSGYHFTFNCYMQFSILIIRRERKNSCFLNRKEGAMQGYPLAMVLYALRQMHLTKQLKLTLPQINQN